MSHPDETCWHEAGHAVVAHLLGARVRCVTLESELEAHDGHAEILWSSKLSARQRARHSALTAMAGPIAELMFRGEDDLDDPAVLASWQNDWLAIESCLTPIAPDAEERAKLRRELALELRRTFADADTHERLARVADMLAAHGTLDETLFGDAVG